MKFKFLFTLLLGSALTASAQQGFKDGVEYFRADQPEEAAIILNRTINDASTDKATAYYYLGRIALNAGDISAAKADFEKGMAADSDNPYNYVGLGAIALRNGDKKAAEDYFKQAKGMAKKDAALLTDIARAYYDADPVANAKELEKAVAEARKANKQSPAIYILEGDMAAPANVGDAAGLYEMAQRYDVNTEYPEAYVKYARTYFSVNPTYSINKLKELLEKQPNSALAQRELAEKYYQNNQLTMAAEQYGKYIQNPNHFDKDKQRYVGLLYFGKKYQESFDLAQQLLQQDPTNVYMQRMLFFNQAAMKNWDSADKYAQEFFKNPKGGFVANDYTTYGEVLQELGQDTLAVAQYEEAVKVNPDKNELLKDLSSAYSSAKMYRQAAETFEKFIANQGEPSTNDVFILARRYQNVAATETDSIAREETVGKALKYVDQVLAKVPENFQALQTRASILYVKNGNAANQDVVDAFLAMVAELDKDPANLSKRKSAYMQAFNLIGNYYLGQGDKANAKIYFTRMLEVDPENEPLRQYLENMDKK